MTGHVVSYGARPGGRACLSWGTTASGREGAIVHEGARVMMEMPVQRPASGTGIAARWYHGVMASAYRLMADLDAGGARRERALRRCAL